MTDKQHITVEELAAQEWFQDYCLKKDEQSIKTWESWKRTHYEVASIAQEAENLVHLLALKPSQIETEREWNRLLATSNFKDEKKKPRQRIISFRLRLAAAVFLLAITAFGLWTMIQPNWQKEQTVFGENKTVLLADGSQVKLNSNSSIRFKENWKWSKNREVYLDGEAYFEVEKSNKAFVVRTKKGAVWVLGTTFNVVQRTDRLGVTLVEGKIRLAIPDKKPIEMKPETSIYLDNARKLSYSKADLRTELAWIDNKMAFSKAKIKEIVVQLKTEFNIDLQVKIDSLLERQISANIPENNPILLLEALATIYDLEVQQIDENTYSLE